MGYPTILLLLDHNAIQQTMISEFYIENFATIGRWSDAILDRVDFSI
jgi:hypothetical protein